MTAVVRPVPHRALAPSRTRAPRVARLALVAALTAGLGAAPALAAPASAATPASSATVAALPTAAPAPGSPEQYIVDRVNQVRAQNGLAPLQYRARLGEVAEAWSQEMARAKVLSHNPRVSSLIEPGWSAWGENVGFAGGYADNAERIVTGWLNSPGHRANILSTRFTSIGVGAATDSRGYLWATQDFATYR
jgi:uncharacterized protein YkwD